MIEPTSKKPLSVLQIGKLITNDYQSLCKIHSISAAGVTVEPTTTLEKGEVVAIGFRSSHILIGRVSSHRDQLMGVTFLQPANVDALFAVQQRAVSGRFLPESVRLEVFGSAAIEIEGQKMLTELFDVSLSGAKLADVEQFMVGARITLGIPGLPLRSGYVRWRRDGRAGIAFNLAMPYEVLSEWVLKQRPRITVEALRLAQEPLIGFAAAPGNI